MTDPSPLEKAARALAMREAPATSWGEMHPRQHAYYRSAARAVLEAVRDADGCYPSKEYRRTIDAILSQGEGGK